MSRWRCFVCGQEAVGPDVFICDGSTPDSGVTTHSAAHMLPVSDRRPKTDCYWCEDGTRHFHAEEFESRMFCSDGLPEHAFQESPGEGEAG
jgi:hypothetical protein